MSRPTMVYIKREMKKVIPPLVLAVFYTVITYLLVFMVIKDELPYNLLALAGYSDIAGIARGGDLFLDGLRLVMGQVAFFGVIFFEFILILRLFATENRSEISDFIRLLPLKEWKKTWIKAGVGEAVILVSCLLFGLAGTVMNAVYTPQVQAFNGLFPGGMTNTDSCLMLWQIVLFVFMAMSAIYLILFAVQLCIHNMLLAFAVGGGILLSIEYFVTIFRNIYGGMIGGIPRSLMEYLPYRIETSLEYMYETIYVYDLEWSFYTDRLLFLLILCIIGIAIILLSIQCHWCIRENNFTLLNSNVVLQFILTGISLVAGMGISFASGNAPLIGTANGGDAQGEFRYWMVSIGIAALFLAVFNLAIMIRKKKQRRG